VLFGASFEPECEVDAEKFYKSYELTLIENNAPFRLESDKYFKRFCVAAENQYEPYWSQIASSLREVEGLHDGDMFVTRHSSEPEFSVAVTALLETSSAKRLSG